MQQVLEGQNRDARRATKAARRAKREARKSSAAVGPEGLSELKRQNLGGMEN
jgi:hypothetical protein